MYFLLTKHISLIYVNGETKKDVKVGKFMCVIHGAHIPQEIFPTKIWLRFSFMLFFFLFCLPPVVGNCFEVHRYKMLRQAKEVIPSCCTAG